MKIKNIVKWTTGTIAGLYVAAYLGFTAHAIYDSKQRYGQGIQQEEQLSLLKVKRFRVKISGKEKYLTLVGEVHSYNKKEYEIAKKLVDEHRHFVYEGGKRGNQSFGNYVYQEVMDKLLKIPAFYLNLGTGRFYDVIPIIAKQKGYNVQGLENPYNVYESLSFDDKFAFLKDITHSALTAPLLYYKAELLEDILAMLSEAGIGDIKLIDSRFQKPLVDGRDIKMSKGIVDRLKKEGVDKLLAGAGISHFGGIIRNMSNQIGLEEIK